MKRAAGFTLLEVLVAVSLSALLLGVIYQGLRAGQQATRSGEAAIERSARVRVAQEFLRRQLAGMLPLTQYSEDNGTPVLIEGESDRLRFVAAMPGYLGRGGPYVQELRLERVAGGYELLFAHRLLNGYDPDEPIDDDEQPAVVLIDGLRDGEFGYLGLEDDGKLADDYSDEWERGNQLPVAVRVALEFADPGQAPWPELITRMGIDPGAAQALREPDFFRPAGSVPPAENPPPPPPNTGAPKQ